MNADSQQPTEIQRQIELSVTNGLGYQNPFRNYRGFIDTDETLQTHLACLENAELISQNPAVDLLVRQAYQTGIRSGIIYESESKMVKHEIDPINKYSSLIGDSRIPIIKRESYFRTF